MPKNTKKTKLTTTRMCGLCLREVNTLIDDYCHLEDFHKGKFYMEGYYHTKCYNDKIKGQEDISSMKKQAAKLLKKAGEMMGMKEEEEMEVINIGR